MSISKYTRPTVALLLVGIAPCWTGCGGTESESGVTKRDSSPVDREIEQDGLLAPDILSKMESAYRQAGNYLDNAQYRERYVRRDNGLEIDVPPHLVSLVYQRPNKLRLQRNVPATDGPGLNVTICANGDLVRAYISDHPEQVLEFACPSTLTVDSLLADKSLRQAILPVPIENLFPQLDVLLASEGDALKLDEVGPAKRLASSEIEGVPCYRIQIDQGEEGDRVLWIDQKSSLLKRMEMPTRQVRAALDPNDQLRDLELWIDFVDAATDAVPEPETFEMQVPQGANRVSQFVRAPGSLPSWLGEQVDDVEFTGLEGDPVALDSLDGKVVVLDFWFTGCAPCRQVAPALQVLYDHYRENERFAMFAVSVDPQSMSSSFIVDTLRGWGAEIPVLRDLDDVGARKLGVTGWPTTLLLGPNGRMHYVSRGARRSYEDWQKPIDSLLAGEDVANTIKEQHAQLTEDFETKLAAVTLPAGSPLTPSAESSQQSQTEKFQEETE